MTILNIAFYIKTGEEKLAMLHTETLYFKIIRILQGEVIALQGVVYSIMALKLLSKYKSKIRDYLSNVDKMMLKIQNIGISLSLLAWIIGIVGIHLEFFNVEIKVDLFIFVYLTLVLVIYIISFAALKSPEIFKLDASQIKVKFLRSQQSSDNVNEETIDKAAASIIKETTLIIEDAQIHDVNVKLIGYIEEEKPYLNPELSLQELADNLEVKRHTLSSAINQIHNKNFYEFINYYRVEEVKSMLTNPKNKHLKLISLAYDSGFNSKATFNRIFKQMTKMTPSQYVLKQQVV
nr:helix-turn-helix transcriptional regulator [Bacteroidota bacterium]